MMCVTSDRIETEEAIRENESFPKCTPTGQIYAPDGAACVRVTCNICPRAHSLAVGYAPPPPARPPVTEAAVLPKVV